MSRQFPIRPLGAVLCLIGSACMARPSEIPAYPLYPNPERHLDASKVAKLVALTNALYGSVTSRAQTTKLRHGLRESSCCHRGDRWLSRFGLGVWQSPCRP